MVEHENNVRIRVAGILLNDNKLLLIAHKKNGKVYWLLPGGGVCFGEPLAQALIRELKEELNIVIKIDKLALIFDSISPEMERHILNVCFYINYVDGEYKLADEDRLYDFNFFDINQIGNIKMYPPINNDLISLLNNQIQEIYLGKRWLEQ